jgi:hypothetical protein
MHKSPPERTVDTLRVFMGLPLGVLQLQVVTKKRCEENIPLFAKFHSLISLQMRPSHFTVKVVFAKYSVRFPRCSIVSRLPQAMM